MFLEFLGERKTNLILLVGLWAVAVAIKIWLPGMGQGSKFAGMIDVYILFGVPAGALWEWFQFRKRGRDR